MTIIHKRGQEEDIGRMEKKVCFSEFGSVKNVPLNCYE